MHADYAKSAEFLFLFVFNAGAGGVANFVTTRERREFIHPLPPAGYSPLSQGESQLQQKTLRKPIVPLRQGRRGAKRRRGWINRSTLIRSPLKSRFPFSPLPPSLTGRAGVGLPIISHVFQSSYTTHSVLCPAVRRPETCCHWLVPKPCELPDALCPPGSAYRRCSQALPASCSL